MRFTYEFAQASPCRGVVGYTKKGPNIGLLTTVCAPHVCNPAFPERNRSNMAGGFDEVKNYFDLPPDTIVDGNVELYREMEEELGPGITKIIPYMEFNERAKHLWDGNHRIGETQRVHSIVQKSLRLTQTEMKAILKLPPTAERLGFKVEQFAVNAFNRATDMEGQVRAILSDYRNKVEQDGAVRLVGKIMKQELGLV